MAEVVWNGTLERQAAEAVRRSPDPDPPRVDSKAMVREALQRMGEATVRALCSATGLTMDAVSAALYAMRSNGELDVCEALSTERSQSGRSLRMYRLREGA